MPELIRLSAAALAAILITAAGLVPVAMPPASAGQAAIAAIPVLA